MKPFRNLSIRSKLLLVILSVTSLAVIIGFSVAITLDVQEFTDRKKRDIAYTARLLADFSVGPLAFDDVNARPGQ